jgi:hypothetical protein
MKTAILICVISLSFAQVYNAVAQYGFPVVCGTPSVNDSFTLITNYFDNDSYTFDMNATVYCNGVPAMFPYVLGLVSYPSLDPDGYNFGFTSYLDLTNLTVGPYAYNTVVMDGTCYAVTVTNTSATLVCNATDAHISPNFSIPVPAIYPAYNSIYGMVSSQVSTS